MKITNQSQRIENVFDRITNEHGIKRPFFQRDLVWTLNQKNLLIDTVMNGLPLPAFFIWETFSDKSVIDGLQRLSTLYAFKNNEFPYSSVIRNSEGNKYIKNKELEPVYFGSNDEEERKEIALKILSNQKKNKKIESIKFMTDEERHRFKTYEILITYIETPNIDEVSELFLRLNGTGKKVSNIDNLLCQFNSEYTNMLRQIYSGKVPELEKYIKRFWKLYGLVVNEEEPINSNVNKKTASSTKVVNTTIIDHHYRMLGLKKHYEEFKSFDELSNIQSVVFKSVASTKNSTKEDAVEDFMMILETFEAIHTSMTSIVKPNKSTNTIHLFKFNDGNSLKSGDQNTLLMLSMFVLYSTKMGTARTMPSEFNFNWGTTKFFELSKAASNVLNFPIKSLDNGKVINKGFKLVKKYFDSSFFNQEGK